MVSSSSIKVVTITGLIILGIILDLGGKVSYIRYIYTFSDLFDHVGGPSHNRIGFRYWKDPGPFAQFENIGGTVGRFLAFCSVLTQAAFSYVGTEVVAVSKSFSGRDRFLSFDRLQQQKPKTHGETYPKPLRESLLVTRTQSLDLFLI